MTALVRDGSDLLSYSMIELLACSCKYAAKLDQNCYLLLCSTSSWHVSSLLNHERCSTSYSHLADADAAACRAHQRPFACDKLHFKRLIFPWTDPTLGNCSYLDTCRHMKGCKYIHYELDDEAAAAGKSVTQGHETFFFQLEGFSSIWHTLCFAIPAELPKVQIALLLLSTGYATVCSLRASCHLYALRCK